MSEKETSANINNLQEALLQQQQKITALREMVRKTDSLQQQQQNKHDNATSEKVKNINKKLNQLKAKARGGHYSGDTSMSSLDFDKDETATLPQTIETPTTTEATKFVPVQSQPPAPSTGSEKILLLRQQMEQNKLRLAQRASSKLQLEQLVSELKEKLDSTQQSLDDTTELGKSMTDLSIYAQTATSAGVPVVSNATITAATRREQRHRSATDLTTQQGFNLEKERIKFLENRCRLLEKQLEKEKQNNNQATSQIEADLEIKQQLENRILILEQDLQLKTQELETNASENENRNTNIELVDNQLKDLDNFELDRLRHENSQLKARINELEEVNDILEATRCDLATTNSEYREKLQNLEDQLKATEDSFEALKSQLNETTTAASTTSTEIISTETLVATEMAKQIQELQNLNEAFKTENIELKDKLAAQDKLETNDEQITLKITNLESTIESQREDLTARQIAASKLEEELMEKTIELNVINANFRVLEEKLQALSKTKSKALFSTTSADGSISEQIEQTDLQTENQQLKQKLDELNKAMIKLKLKSKQTEKQMEKLKKGSKLHEEVIELQKTNEQLQQRITELEDEKGQWQLQQVDADVEDNAKEFVDLTEKEQKNKQLEATIKSLEQQKCEQTTLIENLEKELQSLREQQQTQERVVIARVESEMSAVQLEEQLEQQNKEIEKLQKQLEMKTLKSQEMSQKIEELQLNKQTLEKKLERYINENMELLDKVEKLSKSSSSAESIEIVERLTQQEHAEMVEFSKQQLERSQSKEHEQHHHHDHHEHHTQHVDELTQTEMNYELSESLIKLREESSELMNKVAMFTEERREVLEKMEEIKLENHQLKTQIETLNQEKAEMLEKIETTEKSCIKYENELQNLLREKQQLNTQIAETTAQKSQLSGELSSMQKSTEIIAALDNNESCASLFEKCEKSLSKLETELEAYRRANDKNSKFNISKKLAKEAKNAHTQLSELLQKVKEASTAVETVTVVETVVAVTAPNGKALAEYEQLTAQNRELKITVDELRNKLSELEDASLHETISELVDIKPIETKPNVQEIEQDNQRLTESLTKLQQYETECLDLKNTVDKLSSQLVEVNLTNEAKTGEVTRLQNELKELRKISDNFEKLLSEKEITYEQQIEQFTCLRKELEGKCEVYQGEMEILQTLVTEQKQQLIEAYKEHEHEMNLKMLDLQQRDEQITKLRTELTELRQASRAAGAELTGNLEKECEQLKETLRINKTLIAEQINELSNKQETIDMLNQQLIELYKTMEENTNKVIEKEDTIADLETTIASNKNELERLHKDNEAQKSVVDKLLSELHLHKEDKQQILQLEHEVQTLNNLKIELEQSNKDLEKRNKEQLEKMKKYAANLKKRATQCQELEARVKEFERKIGDTEIQQEFSANIVLLNERISDYELKIKTQESNLAEIQEALQAKTIELLESMENNDKLEEDLKDIRHELMQRDEAIVQLKNALAASQEQTSATNDWEVDEALNEELAMVQSNLMEAREELVLKKQAIEELKVALKESEELREALKIELDGFKEKTELPTGGSNVELEKLQLDLQAKSLKFEKSKAIIKERNNQIQRLQTQLKDLQQKLAAQPEELPIEVVKLATTELSATPSKAGGLETVLKTEFDALKTAYDAIELKYSTEKSAFEKTIERLETLHDGIQAKLQEDMAYIENLESENSNLKEKICKLEEAVGTFEERRASMERRVHFLDAQMHQQSDDYVKAEDELIYRLNMLSEHDDVIAKRLIETEACKDDLQTRLNDLQTKYAELSTQHTKLEKEHKNFQEQSETHLDSELQHLKEKLKTNEMEMQRLRSQYDAKLAVKTTELDELESELSEQLSSINAEKRLLQTDLEKSNDNCLALKDEIVRLNETLNALEQAKQESERELTWLRMQNENTEQTEYELQELRMQSIQDKTEIDNLRQQIEILASNHQQELEALRLQSLQDKTEIDNLKQQYEISQTNQQAEIEALRLQIAELDTLRMQVGQNQTDDQVFIESENKRLSDLLQEKEALIADYQRQNLQLQMAAARNAQQQNQQQPPDLFAALGAENHANAETQNLEQQLNEKLHFITQLQRELESLRETNTELQMELFEKQQQLEAMNTRRPSNQTNNDIIPAPPMFFATNQATTSAFDEIVQRRYETENLTAAISNNSTIEDLQRNVSDLEKYNQELENKLSIRNNHEDELRQRVQQSEDEIKNLQTQLQLTQQAQQQRLVDYEKLESELKIAANQKQQELQARIGELENQLKANIEELNIAKNTAVTAQMSDWHIAELEQRLVDFEELLKLKDKEINELKEENEIKQKLQTTAEDLESQILTTTPAIEQNLGPSLDMFFGNTMTAEATPFEDIIKPKLPQISQEPVVEDLIVPEKAYICHPKDKTTTLDLTNDPWGLAAEDDAHWGAAEVEAEIYKQETQRQTSASLLTREQQLELQLQTANERIQELEMNLNEGELQKQKMQEKLAKSLKVVSKYKTQNEELKKKEQTPPISSGGAGGFFDNLDAAIEDELKAQIKRLETTLEEQRKLQQESGLEKEKLLKRIDVLTAGNERLTEMKERQDMDMEMYKTRINELQQKLNKLDDWDQGGEAEVKVETQTFSPNTQLTSEQQKAFETEIKSLKILLEDLNADKQELQALLDDEKTNVLRIEQSSQLHIQQLQKDLELKQTKELELMEANKILREELEMLQNNLNSVSNKNEGAEFTELKEKLEQAETEVQNMKQQCLLLRQQVNQAEDIKEKLEVELNKIRQTSATTESTEVAELRRQLERSAIEIENLNQQSLMLSHQVQQLQEIKLKLETELAAKSTVKTTTESIELAELKAELEKSRSEVQELNQQCLLLARQLAEAEELKIKLVSELEQLKSTTSTSHTTSNDEFTMQLQEKETEIQHLKKRIEDLMREDQTEKLVLEILTKNQEIHLLKIQNKNLEDEKLESEHNLSLQITKEMQQQQTTALEELNQNSIEKLKTLEKQVQDLQKEKQQMEEELNVLNTHVLNSLEQEDKLKSAALDMDMKNIEINELRQTLEKLKANEGAAPPSAEIDINALNARWESLVEQRCSEIAQMWRTHLEQRESEFQANEQRLKLEIESLQKSLLTSTTQTQAVNITTTGQQPQPPQRSISIDTSAPGSASSTPVSTVSATSPESSSSSSTSADGTPLRIINEADADEIITKMQTALEQQEIEIVSLKEQLAIRSAEYARLAAQYDPFKLQGSGMTTTTTTNLDIQRNKINDNNNAMVPKSELDLALYMLHQRDMRCEEMTVELVALMEERDILQLKLSNTIRQVETIKSQTNLLEANPTTLTDTVSSTATVEVPANLTTESPAKMLATSTADDSADLLLNQKLSQLQTVNHSKDKLIKEERERRIRQMERIQQDVARIPTAAVSELIGTDISQTSQTPSTALLNWLWGNKPPAADDKKQDLS